MLASQRVAGLRLTCAAWAKRSASAKKMRSLTAESALKSAKMASLDGARLATKTASLILLHPTLLTPTLWHSASDPRTRDVLAQLKLCLAMKRLVLNISARASQATRPLQLSALDSAPMVQPMLAGGVAAKQPTSDRVIPLSALQHRNSQKLS